MEVSEHTPGTFCWVELGTTDQQAAKKFYSEIFGWIANDMPMGPDSFYTISQLRGKDAAALYQLSQDMLAQGIPPHWMLYIRVESADDSAKGIAAAGGKVMMEPFDVFDAGRMCVAQDPTGAAFAIWQPNKNSGIGIHNEINAFCWGELATSDAAAAAAFYSEVFGWKLKTGEATPLAYTEISMGAQPFGGMYTIPAEMAGMPPNWMPYFAVDDCDAKASQAKSLGANVILPPQDIPNVGRFSYIADPQGAAFAIIKLNYSF
jgi:predicted enzyme related to lactoylglutathione lyase